MLSSDTPRTRTGKARAELAGALETDFQEVRRFLSDAIQMAEALAAESGGVNGVSSWWRSVVQKLIYERSALDQKIDEVVAALTTHKPPQATPDSSVDEGHLDRVREARAEQAA